MHLAVPEAVAHLYNIRRVLVQAGADQAWMSQELQWKIADWRALADHTAERPTHLDDIVRRKPTHLGFCDISVLGARGVWLDLSRFRNDLVWCHP